MIKNNTKQEDLELARILLTESIEQSKSSKLSPEGRKIVMLNIKNMTNEIKRLTK